MVSKVQEGVLSDLLQLCRKMVCQFLSPCQDTQRTLRLRPMWAHSLHLVLPQESRNLPVLKYLHHLSCLSDRFTQLKGTAAAVNKLALARPSLHHNITLLRNTTPFTAVCTFVIASFAAVIAAAAFADLKTCSKRLCTFL